MAVLALSAPARRDEHGRPATDAERHGRVSRILIVGALCACLAMVTKLDRPSEGRAHLQVDWGSAAWVIAAFSSHPASLALANAGPLSSPGLAVPEIAKPSAWMLPACGPSLWSAYVRLAAIPKAALSPWPQAARRSGPLPRERLAAFARVRRAPRPTPNDADDLSGVPNAYLDAVERAESGGRPYAHAASSTAAGAFQFVDGTWLRTLHDFGASLGFGAVARRVSIDGRGRAYVADATDRQAILNLRYDPHASRLLAAALSRENADHLAKRLGRAPSATELYAAHFLGPRDAETLIVAAHYLPNYPAVVLFPKAARSNKALFFRRGEPVSIAMLAAELATRAGDA